MMAAIQNLYSRLVDFHHINKYMFEKLFFFISPAMGQWTLYVPHAHIMAIYDSWVEHNHKDAMNAMRFERLTLCATSVK